MGGLIQGAFYQLPTAFGRAASKITLTLTRKESLKIYASVGEAGLKMPTNGIIYHYVTWCGKRKTCRKELFKNIYRNYIELYYYS